jgi:cyclic pyranopterin phosphate synthase
MSTTPANDHQLIDRYRRHLNYLRVSITDRCNLRCLYCNPEDKIPKLPHSEILSYEEILRVVRVGVDLGITKVRVTGGEPLLRKDVCDLLRSLSAIEAISDVSLTTNAVLLEPLLPQIWDAGVRRLNISLDSLDAAKYREITGRDYFNRVWRAIEAAHAMGFSPIKINVVALQGYNDREITELARLSIDWPFHVRFIEYMPIGFAEVQKESYLSSAQIKQRLTAIAPLKLVDRDTIDGPAQRYRFEGGLGEVGFISAMSHHFCGTCNRLRLTASGRLRACLMSDQEVDLKGQLRGGASDEHLARIFHLAVRHKPASHHMDNSRPVRSTTCPMSSIGG